MALGANERALILPLEQIHDNTIVPEHIPVPALLRQLHELPVASALPVRFLYIWLLDDPIQVLVQAVKEERNELLRVVLLVAGKLGREALELGFEFAGGVGCGRGGGGPDALQERAEGFCDGAVHAQRVVWIELLLEDAVWRKRYFD